MIRDHIPIIHALIDAYMFFECSGETDVDPDSAVRCMENMSSSLLELEQSDQLALRSHFEKIAEDATDSAYKGFVQSLPDMIGLA